MSNERLHEALTGRVEYTGHRADSGGLQGHSIGSAYPFTVIGVLWVDSADRVALADHSAAHRPTRYVVYDCSTGKTYTRRSGASYATSSAAHWAAEWLKGADIDLAPFLRPTLWKP